MYRESKRSTDRPKKSEREREIVGNLSKHYELTKIVWTTYILGVYGNMSHMSIKLACSYSYRFDRFHSLQSNAPPFNQTISDRSTEWQVQSQWNAYIVYTLIYFDEIRWLFLILFVFNFIHRCWFYNAQPCILSSRSHTCLFVCLFLIFGISGLLFVHVIGTTRSNVNLCFNLCFKLAKPIGLICAGILFYSENMKSFNRPLNTKTK